MCGSIATIGTSPETLTTDGVTMMTPSMSVPLKRLTERRSHPSPVPSCDPL